MQISILGCGWLGLPLADHLIQRGHSIKGSTTTKSRIEELKNHSVEPFLVELNPALPQHSDLHPFWETDALVLNIPPGRGRDNIIDFHATQIQTVADEISDSSIAHVIFISSTSVYPSHPGAVNEADAIAGKAARASGNALFKAEQLLMESSDFATTVLRFGGLIGGDRHPAKYMVGRKNMGKASAPVNLIHRADCIAIITQIIEQKIRGEIFNAVANAHPTRKQYYTQTAKTLGLEPPSFKAEGTSNHKVVSNEKLKSHLTYSFIDPDLHMLP